MKKVTFQFLSSTLSGTQHMLVLALHGTIMNGRQGCSCWRKWRVEIIHLKKVDKNKRCVEVAAARRLQKKFVIEPTAATTGESIPSVTGLMNGFLYIMHVGLIAFLAL